MDRDRKVDVKYSELALKPCSITNGNGCDHTQENGNVEVESFEFHREHLSTTEPEMKRGWRRYAGLIFALLCSLFFSLTVLLAKVLQQRHHSFVITMWRYAGILVPSVPLVLYFQKYTQVRVFETLCPLNEKSHWKNLSAYLMQGILGCTSIIFRFISLQYIPIADSTVVFSSSTVVVTILGHFCLGEKCGIFSVIFAFTTAVGVLVISRPPIITGNSGFDLIFLQGVLFALLALLCTSTFIILMRKIRKTHFALMMLVGGSWGVFESGLLAVILGVFTWPQTPTDWGLITALMILTFLGQTCFVLAIKYEKAAPLSIARSAESIYAFLWQYLFLGVIPDYISITGGLLILTAVICTGYCKYLASLPTDSYTRKRLGFLLR